MLARIKTMREPLQMQGDLNFNPIPAVGRGVGIPKMIEILTDISWRNGFEDGTLQGTNPEGLGITIQ
jgi:hypothetical protein